MWEAAAGRGAGVWVGVWKASLFCPRPVPPQWTCSPQPSPTQTHHRLLSPYSTPTLISLSTQRCQTEKHRNGSGCSSKTHYSPCLSCQEKDLEKFPSCLRVLSSCQKRRMESWDIDRDQEMLRDYWAKCLLRMQLSLMYLETKQCKADDELICVGKTMNYQGEHCDSGLSWHY